MIKLNQRGVTHVMMVAFVIAFAGLASFALIRTFAAKGGNGGGKGGGKNKSTSTLVTFTQQYDNQIIADSSPLLELVDTQMQIGGGLGAEITATKIMPGGEYAGGGKGYGPENPIETTAVKNCYVMNAPESTTSAQITSRANTREVTIKKVDETSGMFWQYECVDNVDGTYVGYQVKNTGNAPVIVYERHYFANAAY